MFSFWAPTRCKGFRNSTIVARLHYARQRSPHRCCCHLERRLHDSGIRSCLCIFILHFHLLHITFVVVLVSVRLRVSRGEHRCKRLPSIGTLRQALSGEVHGCDSGLCKLQARNVSTKACVRTALNSKSAKGLTWKGQAPQFVAMSMITRNTAAPSYSS